jgi:hypothetical protein
MFYPAHPDDLVGLDDYDRILVNAMDYDRPCYDSKGEEATCCK